MKNIFYLLGILFSCNGTKYVCTFDENIDALDFSKGTWILNNPFEKEESRMQYIAQTYFKKVLGDSLKSIDEFRNIGFGLMKAEIPFEPSKEELKEIKTATGYDYLINIKGIVFKDELSGFIRGNNFWFYH